ncbi:protein of unknown function [Pseudomonas sp. JV241A]|nr:protein of unknown function [Pseudomonas sp. JV241A]
MEAIERTTGAAENWPGVPRCTTPASVGGAAAQPAGRRSRSAADRGVAAGCAGLRLNRRQKKTPPKRGFADCFPDILFAPPSWQESFVSVFCTLRFLRYVHVRRLTVDPIFR